MFGLEILDVTIGLIFLYLLVSLIASAIREFIEGLTKTRAILLDRTVRELLQDPEGKGRVQEFYEHPLIYPLFNGAYEAVKTRRLGRTMPSYLPAATFARTVIDLAVRGPSSLAQYETGSNVSAISTSSLRDSVVRIDEPRLRRALLLALDKAGDDITRVESAIQTWFNDAMDRATGRYKRRTSFILFLIGAVLAGSLNVDSIAIARHLGRNKATRDALVGQATSAAADSAYASIVADESARRAHVEDIVSTMRTLELPIGWDTRIGDPEIVWWKKALGLLMTAFAVTLGAPFWFDLLKRLVSIRNTFKGTTSETASTEKATATVPKTPEPQPVAPAAPPLVVLPPVVAARPQGVPLVASRADVEPHEWAVGEPQEGLL